MLPFIDIITISRCLCKTFLGQDVSQCPVFFRASIKALACPDRWLKFHFIPIELNTHNTHTNVYQKVLINIHAKAQFCKPFSKMPPFNDLTIPFVLCKTFWGQDMPKHPYVFSHRAVDISFPEGSLKIFNAITSNYLVIKNLPLRSQGG